MKYAKICLFYQFYRVPQLKLYNSGRLFFHLLNNFLMFKIRFHILQIWTFYDISSFFDLLLQKLIFFQKNIFILFFSKKIKNFFDNFLFEMLVNYFWNTALVKISWYVFQKWWIFIANWKFSKKLKCYFLLILVLRDWYGTDPKFCPHHFLNLNLYQLSVKNCNKQNN